MTKSELLEKYEAVKNCKDASICLYIHMPDDSIETIFNDRAHNKIEYIKKTYNESLVHCNSDQIYIVNAFFSTCEKDATFNFNTALYRLCSGKRVARKGWNGKNMFIYYVPDGHYAPKTQIAKKYCTDENGLVPYHDYIAIKCVDGTVVPWLASQTDILASDWYEVE